MLQQHITNFRIQFDTSPRWPCVLMRCVWDDLASIAGVSTVLPKPFTIPVLLGTVQQHVRSRGDGSVMLLGAIGVAP